MHSLEPLFFSSGAGVRTARQATIDAVLAVSHLFLKIDIAQQWYVAAQLIRFQIGADQDTRGPVLESQAAVDADFHIAFDLVPFSLVHCQKLRLKGLEGGDPVVR